MELSLSAWPDIQVDTVVIPVGSTEQHGPHLPMGTDSAVATAVAREVAIRIRALAAPTASYGSSGEHQHFPGTISIGDAAVRLVVLELVRSISTWAQRVVIVNGHGGNVPALSAVVPQLMREGHHVGWVPCEVRGGDAHAGLIETSIMLHLHPNSVRLDVAVPGNTAPVGRLMTELRRSGVRAVSESGVLGDPTGASAELGVTLFTEMVERVLRRVEVDQPDGRGCLVAT